MDKIMDEENELLDRTDIENYKNGKYVSEQYTKEEWKKLREYYESLEPPKKMGKNRWMYEIKRQFELRKTIEKYPDISIASIEYTLKYRTKYYKV